MSRRSQGMSTTLEPASSGPLNAIADQVTGADSAFSLVGPADMALEARLALIDSATTSLDINTEGGLLIDSEGLAGELAEAVDLLTSKDYAWRVTRGEDGALVWTGKGETRDGSPHRGNMQRLSANLFQQLPIRSQL